MNTAIQFLYSHLLSIIMIAYLLRAMWNLENKVASLKKRLLKYHLGELSENIRRLIGKGAFPLPADHQRWYGEGMMESLKQEHIVVDEPTFQDVIEALNEGKTVIRVRENGEHKIVLVQSCAVTAIAAEPNSRFTIEGYRYVSPGEALLAFQEGRKLEFYIESNGRWWPAPSEFSINATLCGKAEARFRIIEASAKSAAVGMDKMAREDGLYVQSCSAEVAREHYEKGHMVEVWEMTGKWIEITEASDYPWYQLSAPHVKYRLPLHTNGDNKQRNIAEDDDSKYERLTYSQAKEKLDRGIRIQVRIVTHENDTVNFEWIDLRKEHNLSGYEYNSFRAPLTVGGGYMKLEPDPEETKIELKTAPVVNKKSKINAHYEPVSRDKARNLYDDGFIVEADDLGFPDDEVKTWGEVGSYGHSRIESCTEIKYRAPVNNSTGGYLLREMEEVGEVTETRLAPLHDPNRTTVREGNNQGIISDGTRLWSYMGWIPAQSAHMDGYIVERLSVMESAWKPLDKNFDGELNPNAEYRAPLDEKGNMIKRPDEVLIVRQAKEGEPTGGETGTMAETSNEVIRKHLGGYRLIPVEDAIKVHHAGFEVQMSIDIADGRSDYESRQTWIIVPKNAPLYANDDGKTQFRLLYNSKGGAILLPNDPEMTSEELPMTRYKRDGHLPSPTAPPRARTEQEGICQALGGQPQP